MEPLIEIKLDRPGPLQTKRFVIAVLVVLAGSNVAFVMLMFFHDYRSPIPQLVRQVLYGMGFGMLAAQLALHGIWTVFGNWNMFRRALLSVSAALLLLTSFLGTIVLLASLSQGGPAGEEFFVVLLCFPILLIAVQAPFWLMKSGLGWQIAASGSGQSVARPIPMSIRGLLLATAVVAIAFTGVRVASTLGRESATELTIGWTVAAAVAAVVSCLAAVPSLFVTLRARHMVTKLILLVTVDALLVNGVVCIISLFLRWPRREFWFILGAVFAGFALTLLTPLLIARWIGFRLVRT